MLVSNLVVSIYSPEVSMHPTIRKGVSISRGGGIVSPDCHYEPVAVW